MRDIRDYFCQNYQATALFMRISCHLVHLRRFFFQQRPWNLPKSSSYPRQNQSMLQCSKFFHLRQISVSVRFKKWHFRLKIQQISKNLGKFLVWKSIFCLNWKFYFEHLMLAHRPITSTGDREWKGKGFLETLFFVRTSKFFVEAQLFLFFQHFKSQIILILFLFARQIFAFMLHLSQHFETLTLNLLKIQPFQTEVCS